MISVDEAWALIAQATPLTDTEIVPLRHASGRVLASDISAKRTQPPRDVSAMDGYAVRFDDLQSGMTEFSLIGEAPAGGEFSGQVAQGEAVRIFTGGIVPDGADHVVIQEDIQADAENLTVIDAQTATHHIRKAGQDFAHGDILARKGQRLSTGDLALIANGNYAEIEVVRRPRVALIASGDELVSAGTDMTDLQIPDSNSVALSAMLESWGCDVIAADITADNKQAFTAAVEAFDRPDIIVPIGGASVGDYDYAKDVFYALGFEPIFEKIAVKPGKPCWFAKSKESLALGLPGNPTSAMVTARLFLKPLVDKLSGEDGGLRTETALLADALQANGPRENFLRGQAVSDENGRLIVSLSSRQDSALTTTFAEANCLVRRAVHADAAAAGSPVSIIRL
jgi:molybdopterin molybdotransferase